MTAMRHALRVTGCVWVGLAAARSPAAVMLVQDGVAKASVVLRSDAHELEKLAAEELNTYLRKSTGTALPVVSAPEGPGPHVLIGVADAAARQNLGVDGLAFGGFVIDGDDSRLTLAGNVPEGTLNAVYAFLEDQLGVRWFLPTELGENVPVHRTVQVPSGRRRVEPRFVNRLNHGINDSIPGEGDRWRLRLRVTGYDINVPFNRYSHNLYTIFPVSQYGKTHPEFYPVIDGKRYLPATDHAQEWQPCTTNPEVIRLTVEAARKWFAEHPEANYFSVGMNDSAGFCTCSACKALDLPGETFRGRDMVSDRYFTFVRAVADAVHETHPDKYIACIAYWVVETPPKRVSIPANVAVILTQDVAQWHDPAYREADVALATQWAKTGVAFGSYDYTGLTWLLPRVYPKAMADSLRFYDSIGAVAVTNEAYPTWWYAAPQLYLRAKLMWDPKLDADAVLDDFYSGFFGPAKGDMKRFYDVLERCMMKPRPGRWFEGLGSVLDQLELWQEQDLKDCRDALAAAKVRAAGQEPYRARLEFVARGFAFADAVIEEYWQAQALRRLAAAGQPDAEAVLGGLRELLQHRQQRERAWESIRDDRLLSGIYRLLFEQFSGRLTSWQSYLDSSASIAISVLAAAPSGFSVERIQNVLSEFAAESVTDALRVLLWVRQHPEAENLCGNPDFEATAGGDGAAPTGADWVSTQAPPRWSKWALEPETVPRMTWEKNAGRNDSRCVRICGATDACFIYVQTAKPGERYYASAWARAEGTEKACARLVVQWQDADGRWVWSQPRREATVSGTTNGWRQLALTFVVPQDVGRAVILLAAKDQAPNDTAWFDDVRVLRLPEAADAKR